MTTQRRKPASPKRSTAQAMEKFAQLVALGMSQARAYREATGSKAKDETVCVQASKWAHKDHITSRVAELLSHAKEKANKRYVYDYEDAMREADEAMKIARIKKDAKAMATIVALKGKFSGLETEARRNERPPFDGMTDEELLDGINRDMHEAGITIQ